jgi:hypothetical protein
MRFTITQGRDGWQVFDREINAPIGECFPTRDLAQAAANRDNQMYGDEQSRQLNRIGTWADYEVQYEVAREDAFDRADFDYYRLHNAE